MSEEDVVLADKDAVIVAQAQELCSLRQASKEDKAALAAIHMQLVGIGGPLNDNYHRYTPQQLAIFHRIKELVGG